MAKKKVTAPTPATAAVAAAPEPETQPNPPSDGLDVFVSIFDTAHLQEKRDVIRAWLEIAKKSISITVPDVNVTLVILEQVAGDPAQLIEKLELTDDVVYIQPVFGPPSEFQRARRILAEAAAGYDLYILADSDCMPIVSASYLRMAVELMSLPGYAEFGMLSAMPQNANIQPWTPPLDEYPGGAYNDMRVMEHVDVGGIRMIRSGVMPIDADLWWPQSENRPNLSIEAGWKYDRAHAEQMRQRGYRVGYIKAWPMVHLGEGRGQ